MDGDDLVIAISDRGHGFDEGEVRKRHTEPRGKRGRRGWGLKLIDALVDEAEIESDQNGTTIRMVQHGR